MNRVGYAKVATWLKFGRVLRSLPTKAIPDLLLNQSS